MAGSVYKSHRRRHKIADRDGWECRYCQVVTECKTCRPHAKIMATIDHVVPIALGGTNALANMAIACHPCNQAKADDYWPASAITPGMFSPDGTRDPGYVPKWRHKRLLANGGVNLPDCPANHTRGKRPAKTFATQKLAQDNCDSVYAKDGVTLAPKLCARCGYWHAILVARAVEEAS